MTVSPELLEILVCPETKQPIALAGPDVLARINAEIDAGRLRNRGGEAVKTRISEGLVRQDGRDPLSGRRRHSRDADRRVDRARLIDVVGKRGRLPTLQFAGVTARTRAS